ncbi:MAG: hypothetical protein V3S14_03485 [Anaerolineae bacterium]
MDNLDLYADEELYEDEEEEAVEEEGSNRTFIILVASLGGLLAVTVCIFVIWAFVINPRMTASRVEENQAIEATNEALLAAGGVLTGTVPLEDATPVPPDVSDELTATAPPSTATPRPATATPVPPTVTATPAEAADATPVEAADATPAEVAGAATTAAPESTATPRATTTPRPGKSGIPETGIGTLWGSVLAVGLLFLLLVVRRMRRAV